ncbi:WD40 repeat domain-containing protein [Rhodotorula paludigena]|uniref:WD40 repeat domain-containing protein n=1 Tax=Rhodotorula paludigena TaxID=86838 RepID=UPI00317C9512
MADHQEQQAAEQHTGDEQQQLNNEDEQPIFLTEDDVLEVEDMADGDDRMEDDSDDDGNNEAGPSGEQQGDDDRDDAMDLLDGGFDDSVALAQLHRSEGGAVFCLAVHPFAATLAVSGGEDDQAFVFRTDTGAQVAQLSGHTDSVTSVAWSHDGALVATGGMDGKVNVWKARRPSSDMAWEETGWEFLISLEGPDEVNWIDWHPKGNVLLAGGADGTVWVWNLPSGATMHVLSGHTSPVTCGRFTPDGKKILTASEDSTLILWDPRTGEPVHKLGAADARFRLEGGINCLAVNPASTVAIVGGAEGGLRAVNLVQGTVLAQLEGHEEGASIEQVAFNEIPTVGGGAAASVTVVVSVGVDGRVCTWEASGFKLRSTGTHEDAVTSLSFSPHTPTFLTGSADKTLKLWDYRTGACLRTLLGNRDIVHAVSVSRDGRVAVSGSEDGSVRTFRLDAQEGQR